MQKFIISELSEISQNFVKMQDLAPQIEKTAQACFEAIKNGYKILLCGNGGSAADAQHFAAEIVGRYRLNRPAMNAVALTVDTSILTAVGNDYGYDTVFERQVEGLGQKGDVLISFSTSGNSKNCILAMKMAQKKGLLNVAITGQSGGEMKGLADFALCVPSSMTNHIQPMHLVITHFLCGFIEEKMYGK